MLWSNIQKLLKQASKSLKLQALKFIFAELKLDKVQPPLDDIAVIS